MAMTLAEKIVARAAGRERVMPGEIVTCAVDLAMIHDSGGPRRVAPILKRFGVGLWDPSKVVLISDHYVPGRRRRDAPHRRGHARSSRPRTSSPASTTAKASATSCCRSAGISSPACSWSAATAIRRPAAPSAPTCSASARPRWPACSRPARSGSRVPETIEIEWRGKFGPCVVAKDVMLFLCGQLGMEGGRTQAVHFRGEAIARAADAGAHDARQHDGGARRPDRPLRSRRNDGVVHPRRRRRAAATSRAGNPTPTRCRRNATASMRRR